MKQKKWMFYIILFAVLGLTLGIPGSESLEGGFAVFIVASGLASEAPDSSKDLPETVLSSTSSETDSGAGKPNAVPSIPKQATEIVTTTVQRSEADTLSSPDTKISENEEVSVSNGMLSVRLKDADLFDVMKTLSSKSGMRIKIDKEASKRITLTFRDMPFEKGIRNLIRPLNYAMIWERGKEKEGVAVDVLVELRVFREGNQGGETVDFGPEEEEEIKETKVKRSRWSEEKRRQMLEKLRARPTSP